MHSLSVKTHGVHIIIYQCKILSTLNCDITQLLFITFELLVPIKRLFFHNEDSSSDSATASQDKIVEKFKLISFVLCSSHDTAALHIHAIYKVTEIRACIIAKSIGTFIHQNHSTVQE